ncbi:MAG TPA: Asp-tRNA(Asn)/Glu-tRNA(Gln) amidotransferase subunit GatB, partial [Polyangia bacterium]|nr:Asp-tRNA(Asn)/Glu-tRNA(Gln) amidotransferase subunit GatB [Polyangia bacterium]
AAVGAAPNTHTDPYTLALPGTLPVLNRAAVAAAMRLGLAVGGEVGSCRFARKHYFYPDLPKGYQISQLDEPLCKGGIVELLLEGEVRRVRLTRIHMEEDAGKSMHAPGAPYSLVDYNRAGVPLVEIVSEPDLRSAAEAAAYVRAIRQLVRWLGISDGNMEEGSLRCDANVSVRPVGEAKLGTKAELKNMNSFKHVEAAIEYEIARQSDLVARGERVVQETRLWNADKGTSHAMRSKEQAHDYRYFPEPDLPPLVVDEAWIARVRGEQPELPIARWQRFQSMGLSAYDAGVLTAERELADYFDSVVKLGAPAKPAANWIMAKPEARPQPEFIAQLIALVEDRTISSKIGKDVFERMTAENRSPRDIVEAEGLVQVSDAAALERACRQAVDANPKQVAQYKGGNPKIIGFFVGQVMKATQGKANPEMVNQILRKLLA